MYRIRVSECKGQDERQGERWKGKESFLVELKTDRLEGSRHLKAWNGCGGRESSRAPLSWKSFAELKDACLVAAPVSGVGVAYEDVRVTASDRAARAVLF